MTKAISGPLNLRYSSYMFKTSATVLALVASQVNAAPVFTARSADLETYLSLVTQTEGELERACLALEGKAPSSGQAWLRIGQRGLEIAPDEARDAEAAAFWAEVALGARSAARRLYSDAAAVQFASGPVLIELKQGMASTYQGESRTEGDLCDAMSRLVGAMGGEAAANPFAAAREIIETPAAPVAIGGVTEISMETPLSAGSTLRGPDGIAAEVDEDGVNIRLSANSDARVGDAVLRIYPDGEQFRSTEEIPITILPGNGSPLPARQVGALAPGGGFAGELPLGGTVELDMTLKQARTMTLAAISDSDLSVEVVTKTGQPVARDDDSGRGYGFSLSASLPAGGYVVKITHCCGGGGAFAVSATSE